MAADGQGRGLGLCMDRDRKLNGLACLRSLPWPDLTGLNLGLDWTGLDWTGLVWTGLDWAAGLGCWTGLDCTALDFTVVAAH